MQAGGAIIGQWLSAIPSDKINVYKKKIFSRQTSSAKEFKFLGNSQLRLCTYMCYLLNHSTRAPTNSWCLMVFLLNFCHILNCYKFIISWRYANLLPVLYSMFTYVVRCHAGARSLENGQTRTRPYLTFSDEFIYT